MLRGAVLPDPDHHSGPLHHPLSVEEHEGTALKTVVLDWIQQGTGVQGGKQNDVCRYVGGTELYIVVKMR